VDRTCDASELWERYRESPGDATRAALIEVYAPLVRVCVHQMGVFLTAVLSLDDLVSAGTLGLIAAVDRFDASRGVKFETFAAFRIRGAVLDAVRSMDPLTRAARRGVNELRERTKVMEQELSRPVSIDEAAATLGHDSSASDLRSAALVHFEVSLSNPSVLLDDESDLTLEDILPDCDQPDPDSVVETAELWRTVAEGVALLPPRERTIIEQHYSQDVSLRELGQRLAISQSRVYQIHHRAIRRLRSHVDSALSHGRTLATA